MAIVEYAVAECDKCPAKLPGQFESVVRAERAAERAGWWWGGTVTHDALLCTNCRPRWQPVVKPWGVEYEPRETAGAAP